MIIVLFLVVLHVMQIIPILVLHQLISKRLSNMEMMMRGIQLESLYVQKENILMVREYALCVRLLDVRNVSMVTIQNVRLVQIAAKQENQMKMANAFVRILSKVQTSMDIVVIVRLIIVPRVMCS